MNRVGMSQKMIWTHPRSPTSLAREMYLGIATKFTKTRRAERDVYWKSWSSGSIHEDKRKKQRNRSIDSTRATYADEEYYHRSSRRDSHSPSSLTLVVKEVGHILPGLGTSANPPDASGAPMHRDFRPLKNIGPMHRRAPAPPSRRCIGRCIGFLRPKKHRPMPMFPTQSWLRSCTRQEGGTRNGDRSQPARP